MCFGVICVLHVYLMIGKGINFVGVYMFVCV